MSASAWHFHFYMSLYVSNGKFISVLFLSNSLRETKINLKLSIWISYPSFSSLLHASKNGACKTIESVLRSITICLSHWRIFCWHHHQPLAMAIDHDFYIYRWKLITFHCYYKFKCYKCKCSPSFFHSKQRNCDKTESIWLYRLSGYFSIILVKR